MISLSKEAVVLEINGAILKKNYNIYVSEIIFYLSSHLTPNGLETLAKLRLIFKIRLSNFKTVLKSF
jgi:hypothetical protein